MIKNILLASLLFIAIVGLPITIFLFRDEQDLRTKAAATTTISLITSNNSDTIEQTIGTPLQLDLVVNPDKNAIAVVNATIHYDSTLLKPSENFFVFDNHYLADKGPTLAKVTTGEDTITLLIYTSDNPLEAPTEITTLGSINFDTIAQTDGTPTMVSVSKDDSFVTSIAASDTADEDVLSLTNPAFITISNAEATTTQTTTQSPDLLITAIEAKPNPTTNDICSSPGLLVTIKNQGSIATSTSFTIKANNATKTVTELFPGETTQHWFETYLIGDNTVHVDTTDTVIESDETNNTFTQNLSSVTLPQTCSGDSAEANTVGESNTFAITAYLHGIGNSGDNSNPTEHTYSNKEPKRQQRPFTIEIYNASNQLVATQTTDLLYQPNEGNFQGLITLNTSLAEGDYIIKLKTDSFLTKRIPGFLHILPVTEVTLPTVTLVAGDIDGNNLLNILDFSLIIDCYTETTCTPEMMLKTDLNDDGKTDPFDFNLLAREFVVQTGE